MTETCSTCRWWEELLHEGEGTAAGVCQHVMTGVKPNQWAMAIMPGANLVPITTGHGYCCPHAEPKGDGECHVMYIWKHLKTNSGSLI